MTFHSIAGCSRGAALRGFLMIGSAGLLALTTISGSKPEWESLGWRDALNVLTQMFIAWRMFLDQSLSGDGPPKLPSEGKP